MNTQGRSGMFSSEQRWRIIRGLSPSPSVKIPNPKSKSSNNKQIQFPILNDRNRVRSGLADYRQGGRVLLPLRLGKVWEGINFWRCRHSQPLFHSPLSKGRKLESMPCTKSKPNKQIQILPVAVNHDLPVQLRRRAPGNEIPK